MKLKENGRMKKIIQGKKERGGEIDEYDTIKSSLNSEIETFVFHILCKASKSSFRLRLRLTGERENRIYSYTIFLSGVPVD